MMILEHLIFQNITKLDFSKNNQLSAGFYEKLRNLIDHSSILGILNLQANNIKDAKMIPLLESVSTLKKLRELNIARNELTD